MYDQCREHCKRLGRPWQPAGLVLLGALQRNSSKRAANSLSHIPNPLLLWPSARPPTLNHPPAAPLLLARGYAELSSWLGGGAPDREPAASGGSVLSQCKQYSGAAPAPASTGQSDRTCLRAQRRARRAPAPARQSTGGGAAADATASTAEAGARWGRQRPPTLLAVRRLNHPASIPAGPQSRGLLSSAAGPGEGAASSAAAAASGATSSIPTSTAVDYFAFFLGTGAGVLGTVLLLDAAASCRSCLLLPQPAYCAMSTRPYAPSAPHPPPHSRRPRSAAPAGLCFLGHVFFVFLPMIILAPAKFAMTFSIGSGALRRGRRGCRAWCCCSLGHRLLEHGCTTPAHPPHPTHPAPQR